MFHRPTCLLAHLFRRNRKMPSFEAIKFLRGFAEVPSQEKNLNTYETAIAALNDLATNSTFLQRTITRGSDTQNVNIQQTLKYLQKAGMQPDELDKLKVIHVSGTKGKGSTCAYVESILRHHGLRTGFYSSPHLVSVTERIRLGGLPISHESFAKYFWLVYGKLLASVETKNDLPPYFQFLTVLSFFVFLHEGVEVAIIEVGIGGEFDCTNIVRNTKTVGITSLGLDHTKILGDTIEKIAWQKAGITKEGSDVFTVTQPEAALDVIKGRAAEKKANFHLVPAYNSYKWTRKPNLEFDIDVQKLNISLAIQLAHNWMFHQNNESQQNTFEVQQEISEKVTTAIERSFWPGRCHFFEYLDKNFYLDGAHTLESVQVCTKWFRDSTRDSKKRILIFNVTGGRDVTAMIKELQTICFDAVYFVPNVAMSDKKHVDQLDTAVGDKEQLENCRKNETIWHQTGDDFILAREAETKVLDSVLNVLNDENVEGDILVTGSLHLVGACIQAIEEFDKLRSG